MPVVALFAHYMRLFIVLFSGNKGDKGLGAVPGRQAEFREALGLAVKYAKILNCPRY